MPFVISNTSGTFKYASQKNFDKYDALKRKELGIELDSNIPLDNMLMLYRFNTGDLNTTGATYKLANYAPYNQGAIVAYDANVGTDINPYITIDNSSYIVGNGSLNISVRGLSGITGPTIVIGASFAFTHTVWFKLVGTIAVYDRIADWGGPGWFQIMSSQTSSANYLFWNIRITGGAQIQIEIQVNVMDGAWHHVATVCSSSGDWTIYIDNIAYTKASPLWRVISNAGTNSIGNLIAGTWSTTIIGGGGSTRTFAGNRDDIRLYSRELTSTEIGQIYNYRG